LLRIFRVLSWVFARSPGRGLAGAGPGGRLVGRVACALLAG